MGYRQQSAPIIISRGCSQCCSAVIVKVKIIITLDCFTGLQIEQSMLHGPVALSSVMRSNQQNGGKRNYMIIIQQDDDWSRFSRKLHVKLFLTSGRE